MKLSIIIPVLNEEQHIRILLDYLLHTCTPQADEIIVVDGGSSDKTIAIAAQFGVKVIETQRGRAIQMNEGARVATGNVLYFIHADTLPPKSFYTDIEAAIQQGYGFGCYRLRFKSSRILLKVNSWCTRFNRIWLRGGDQTLFVSKMLFEQLKGYDPHYVIMEEYDFLLRANKVAKFILMPKDVLVSDRKYEKNSWLRVQLANLKAVRMFSKQIDPLIILKEYKQRLR